MAHVRIDAVQKEFVTGDHKVVALEEVTLDVEGATFVSIVGPSGCGKSTLLNILAGIESPDSGTVSITQDGETAAVGYVFQAPRLLPWRSILDNLYLVQRPRNADAKARCREYLEMVGLGDVEHKYPGQLSGGMQQRVGIARAFAVEPDLLLMDEPFSHLDAITGRTLRRELHEMWAATGKTVIFVTHDVGEAIELSNRVVVMRKGGHVEDDVTIDLPFPRDGSDDRVALAKADLLRRFEEMDLLAS
ncbi:MAG: ATP-binding cassette domain-containing protein [Streptosporangiales bacterium]|nr:ATP-binding cassette domain-containing protein [Streptosporangiales bacterium]